MELFRDRLNPAGLLPQAYVFLAGGFADPLYNQHYGLRVPFGTYAVSLQSVFERASSLLDGLEEFHNKNTPPSRELLPEGVHVAHHLDPFLDSLAEHLEDCVGIVRSFYPKKDKKQRNKAVKRFKKRIQQYQDHVGRIVNAVKHHQNRLLTIYFVKDQSAVLGYYVGAARPDGMIGPNPDIHANSMYAFSYNRDLRFHIANVYEVSTNLVSYLETHTKPKCQDAVLANSPLFQLVESCLFRVSTLPPRFLHYEKRLPIPYVQFSIEADRTNCSIDIQGDVHGTGVEFHPKRTSIIATAPNDGIVGQHHYFPFVQR